MRTPDVLAQDLLHSIRLVLFLFRLPLQKFLVCLSRVEVAIGLDAVVEILVKAHSILILVDKVLHCETSGRAFHWLGLVLTLNRRTAALSHLVVVIACGVDGIETRSNVIRVRSAVCQSMILCRALLQLLIDSMINSLTFCQGVSLGLCIASIESMGPLMV